MNERESQEHVHQAAPGTSVPAAYENQPSVTKLGAAGVCIAGERCSCACLVRTDLRARCNLWQPREEKSHE
jgi:hypothetical protein